MASENSEYLSWKEDIIKNKLGGKREWTDQERTELCMQLDREFDKKFKNIPKCDQNDRWTEENWKEKMSEHPLFASFLQEEGGSLIAPDNALSEGIAQLKYDPEHSTAEEIAENYREEGNIYYKAKKYKLGIISYTEALKQKIEDKNFLSRIYNNRSACHFSLGNYRSSLNDCEKAISLKPLYSKSIERAAKCSLKLKLYTDCFTWCDEGEKIPSLEKNFIELRKQARKEKIGEAAKKRRQQVEEQKIDNKNRALLKAFKDKEISVYNDLYLCDMEELKDKLSNARVKQANNGDLEWDVVFIYPEYSESDLVEEFNENTRFIIQLKLMFDQTPSWDLEQNYELDMLSLYFNDKDTGIPVPVDMKYTLSNVLKDKRYPIDTLFPTFLLLSKNSPFQKEFLQKYSK